MSPAIVIGAVLIAAAVAVGATLWYAWRRWLQLCPHCSWIVRRVQRGWLRCPRCHRQYARRARLRPH